MTLTIDKKAVVFNGGHRRITTIKKGTYVIEEIVPLESDAGVKWYQFAGTKKIIGLNPKNLPEGMVLVA